MKSFRPKDGSGEPPGPGRNGECDFKGEKRSNETHRSTTDDDARLFRKGGGQASQLCFIGHVLMENRNGLAVDAELTRAAGSAERLAALAMAENLPAGDKTLGADKGYDTHDFVMELREIGITPHVAQNAYATETARRRSAIDGRTTRHEGYAWIDLRLVPSFDGGDDFVGVGRPDEGLGIAIDLFDEAVDGGLEIDDGAQGNVGLCHFPASPATPLEFPSMGQLDLAVQRRAEATLRAISAAIARNDKRDPPAVARQALRARWRQ